MLCMKYEEIFKLHYNLIKKVAYQVLQNNADAEDVAMEVFYKLMEYTGRTKSDAPITDIKNWLIITTRRTAFEYKDRFYKFQTVPLDENIHTGDKPTAQVEMRVFINDMLEDLNKYNPRWFTVIALHALLDLSYKQISLAFDISLPMVKIEIYRARNYMYHKNHITYNEAMKSLVVTVTLGAEVFCMFIKLK